MFFLPTYVAVTLKLPIAVAGFMNSALKAAGVLRSICKW